MRRTIIIAALAALALTGGISFGVGYPLGGFGYPPTLTCGTSASLATGSTALDGTVDVGTSAGTSCTLTWPTTAGFAWPYTPFCTITFVDSNNKGNIPIWIHSQSTSALVIDAASDISSSGITYRCRN